MTVTKAQPETQKRRLSRRCLTSYTILSICALGLFFGLFFGLNYQEILRYRWPLTQCTVTSTAVTPRYCCYADCHSGCGGDGAKGAPKCSSLTEEILRGEHGGGPPEECARNSTACPTGPGRDQFVCDNGYYCYSKCCNTCTSCSTSCSGGGGAGSSPSCSTTCITYICNCYCCSSTDHRSCTVQCPLCFTVSLGMSYTPDGFGTYRNVSYSQDFKQNRGDAETFAKDYAVGTAHKCYYNRKNLDEISLDVSFTRWKWAITAVFGMVPLLAVMLYGG